MNEFDRDQPLVSVVIPCYNHEKYVQECILSVIEQDYNNIELIIIDDGSNDLSVSRIQEMILVCEKRFSRFEFRSRPNIGLSATLNEALKWCRGVYVAPVASDDQWLNCKLSKQVEYLNVHPDVVAVFGGIQIIDSSGNVTREIVRQGKFQFRDIFLHKHFLPAPTALIRCAELKKVGYDSAIKIEDWNVWLKLAKQTEMYFVSCPQVFARYRRHDGNMSRNSDLLHSEGLKILAQFRQERDYKQALAEFELAMSALLAFESKKKAFLYFYSYLKFKRLSSRVVPVLIKILIPRFVARYLP